MERMRLKLSLKELIELEKLEVRMYVCVWEYVWGWGVGEMQRFLRRRIKPQEQDEPPKIQGDVSPHTAPNKHIPS